MVCVIIPSLNPSRSLIDYVQQIIYKSFGSVIIINDGSDEKYDNIFASLDKINGCEVLTHSINKGKGAALKTGYKYFIQNYPNYKGVITADSDGQHDVEDIIKIAEMLNRDNNKKAILGQRDLYNKNVPIRSRIGNATSALLFSLLYGCNIWDTQSGLRGFSADMIEPMLDIKGDRYDYEMNVLSYLRVNNISIIKIAIKTIYIDNNKGSHYRTFYDTTRIFIRIIGSFFSHIYTSLVSSIIDISIFAFCYYLIFFDVNLAQKIFISTIIARICSSIINYLINHKNMSTSNLPQKDKIIKYYFVWVLEIIISFFVVLKLSIAEKVNIIFIKFVVDLLISIIVYQVQKRLDFKKKTLKYQ